MTSRPSPTKLAGYATSKIRAALAGLRIRKPYVIPVANLPCEMILVGADRLLAIEAESNAAMDQLGYDRERDADRYGMALAIRILAESAVEVGGELPVDTADGWGGLPPEAIQGAYTVLCDLRAANDPLASTARLTQEEYVAIREAIAEKKTASLLAYGLQKLTVYLLITESLRTDSLTQKHSPGDTPPGSSASPMPA